MLEVRTATVADYDAYARLFLELGIDEPVPSRERFAELADRMVVAVDDGVVGYALYEVLAEIGYIRNVVSDPSRRRSGIGVALMATMRDRFVAAGATSWCLNVKPTNVAAIGLYERFGMRRVHRTTVVRLPREVVLPAPPPELALVPIPAETDPVIEPRFHLLRGQLASARSKGGREVVQLVRGDQVLAIGVFAVAIPGAFPCRIGDASDTAALLAHLRTLAPSAAWIQVGAEDDEPFRAELLRLGAYVNLEIVHMRGAL